jgi:hypothetical protein
MGRTYRIRVRGNLSRDIETPLQQAVYHAMKSAIRLSDATERELTPSGVHYLLSHDPIEIFADGRVRSLTDVPTAELIEKATTAAGHPVPALELLGLAPWRGPDRFAGGADLTMAASKAKSATRTRGAGAANRRSRSIAASMDDGVSRITDTDVTPIPSSTRSPRATLIAFDRVRSERGVGSAVMGTLLFLGGAPAVAVVDHPRTKPVELAVRAPGRYRESDHEDHHRQIHGTVRARRRNDQ